MKRKTVITERFGRKLKGELEFIIKDRHGNVIDVIRDHNIVKIFAKEILSHRMPFSKIWDPEAGTEGDWVDSNLDPDEDFAVKYILIRASFDEDGVPLDTNDPRYYTIDSVTNLPVPVRLEPGAWYNGGLINAIPIAEPDRPLKRIENVEYEPTYQPAGTPLLQEDVRAMNNIAMLETTLKADEYNGFGASESDYFTITEVALAAGKTLGLVGACEKTPREIFLEGTTGSGGDDAPMPGLASGGDIVTIDDPNDADIIRQGDQIKIVSLEEDSSGQYGDLDQVTPFYLVLAKSSSGQELQLDRVPANSDQVPIEGAIGVYRDTLRIFSHRILQSPIKKSADFEILCRWRIIFS
jgi:hypothetical protein